MWWFERWDSTKGAWDIDMKTSQREYFYIVNGLKKSARFYLQKSTATRA